MMKRFNILALLCVICLAAVSSAEAQVSDAVLEAQKKRIAAMDKARPSVVLIFAKDGNGGGSGVLVTSDGYALSNYHVTSACGVGMKCGLSDGKVYDAVIVGIDPTGDVALIKLLGRDDFPYATFGNSDEVKVGDSVFAMGNPFLLATDFQPTTTFGMVSGVHRYQYPAGTLLEYGDCIQVDASINPGNSGGPLFNDKGEVIGINGRISIEKRGRVNVGVGYAISINQIRNFWGYLKSGRLVDHATLGATVGTSEDGDVVVTNILRDSDAYRRGLRYDDEIISFVDRSIGTVNAFKNALAIYPKGWRIPIKYRQEGETKTAHVRLKGLHRAGELAKMTGQSQDAHPPIPKDDKDPDKKEKPEDPRKKLQEMMKKKKEVIPEVVKKVYEKRAGYANYYFNKLNQKRVWESFFRGSKFDTLAGAWVLKGRDTQDREFQFELADERGRLTIGGQEAIIENTEELHEQLAPAQSGGLLTALLMWRHFCSRALIDAGDIYYLGTAPVPGSASLADVLVLNHALVETRYYFDSETGEMLLMEMFPEDHRDPCEIRFLGEKHTTLVSADNPGGTSVPIPQGIEVTYGDNVYGVFVIHEINIEQKTKE